MAMYWSGAVQHSWNYDYKRYFIYDPTQPTRGFTQNWDDTGLHEAWLKKAPLDEAFFRESTKPLQQPADRSFWRQLRRSSAVLPLSNRTRTHQVTATKIEMLERNLFQHMKDRGLNRISSTLASLNRAVGFCNEKQVFEKIHADDRLLVEERYADFRKHAFSTTDNSLEVMLEELTGEFRWGDDDIQQAIITLVPFMVQCMELKLILNANLATIYRARGDNLTAADHDAAFYNGIDEVIYRLRDIGKSLNVWMKKQQEERLALFSANVEQLDQNDPKFPIVPDRRTWKITDHGSKRVFAVYGSRYDISMNTNEADVSDKMKGYMGEMASWYADRLKEHTDKHFVMLRDSVEKWNQVADHLNTHWKDGGQEEAPDGVRMYYQMRGLLKADDPKPAKAT